MSGLVVTAAPLMSEARAYADLNGVRVYMLHKPGRGGGHYASVSASGGVNEVIAFPEGAAFASQARLKAALKAAHERGESVAMVRGVGAMLQRPRSC